MQRIYSLGVVFLLTWPSFANIDKRQERLLCRWPCVSRRLVRDLLRLVRESKAEVVA
jgi:hypothetical protein